MKTKIVSKKTTDEKVQSAIQTTQYSMDFQMEQLKSYAKTMILHARQAQEFLDNCEKGQVFIPDFFPFEFENCKKAMSALETLDGLRNTISALQYIARNDEE